MKKALLAHWPFIISVSLLWITVTAFLAATLRQNQGHLVYALDDPYIHMAVAKNFALHGVWGVSRDEFSSSSSSLLWTLLLSLTYRLAGVNEASPLLLNLVFVSLVLLVADAILRYYQAPPTYSFAALLVVAFITSLPGLVFTGLEHSLHTALTLLANFLAARLLSDEAAARPRRDLIFLLLLAPLVTTARFEGTFFVLVIAGLFVLRKAWSQGLAIAACGLLPVVVYGLISVERGWSFLPSSVLLKSRFSGLMSIRSVPETIGDTLYSNIALAPHLFYLLIAVVSMGIVSFDRRRRLWESRQVMATIFLATTLGHLAFAAIGSFYRYEAYLLALGGVVMASQLSDSMRRPQESRHAKILPRPIHAAILVLALLLMAPLVARGGLALSEIRRATANIFQQQYQMGLFVRQFYQGSTVALNDIGAVSFLADIRCVDLWGLATPDVMKQKMQKDYHTKDIGELTKEKAARIAIVYDNWFGGQTGGLPRAWMRAGQWRIENVVVAGGDRVSIYAVQASEFSNLVRNLREFSSTLPKEVTQTGRYTESLSAAR